MYSARLFFEGILTEQDFPEQIELAYHFPLAPDQSYGPVILSRTNQLNAVGQLEIVYIEGQEPNTNLRSIDNSPDFGWASSGDGGALVGSTCLTYITEQYIGGQLIYIETCRDFFANTYSVTGPFNGIINRTNRASIIEDSSSKFTTFCGEWLGNGLKLIFNGTIGKWTLNGFQKSGLQNTPQGNYGPYSVT